MRLREKSVVAAWVRDEPEWLVDMLERDPEVFCGLYLVVPVRYRLMEEEASRRGLLRKYMYVAEFGAKLVLCEGMNFEDWVELMTGVSGAADVYFRFTHMLEEGYRRRYREADPLPEIKLRPRLVLRWAVKALTGV